MSKTNDLRIEYVPLSKVRPSPKNPKRHELDEIKASMRRFGFTEPMLEDEGQGQIVAGHGRREALMELRAAGAKPPLRIRVAEDGEWLVPVVFGVRFSSEKEAAAYLVASNRTSEIGGWDDEGLAVILQSLGGELEGTGYKETDLSALLRSLDPDPPKPTRKPPPAKEPPGKVLVHHADCMAWLKTQPDNYFDAFFADPPYGMSPDGKTRTWDDIEALRAAGKKVKGSGFMGRAWDAGVPGVSFWREVLRVLKPGAPILAFGATRGYHRMVCAMEDAGAEVGDCIVWLYGQGFPKSLDLSKAIDKAEGTWRGRAGKLTSANAAMGGPNYERTPKGEPVTAAAVEWDGRGTALKPAWEPCALAFKPLEGTYVENVKKWGVGAIAIDASRISFASEADRPKEVLQPNTKTKRIGVHDGKMTARNEEGLRFDPGNGRWPSNAAFDETAAAMLDAQAGERGKRGSDKNSGVSQGMFGVKAMCEIVGYGDSGGASRFFYVAKVSKWEREYGCAQLPSRVVNEASPPGSTGAKSPRAGASRGSASRNHHPTLKPIRLNEYLARLVLPPKRSDGVPRRLLIPFGGAGSEAIGAMRVGWDEVHAVEREAEYIPILQARVKAWAEVPEELLQEQREKDEEGVDDDDEAAE